MLTTWPDLATPRCVWNCVRMTRGTDAVTGGVAAMLGAGLFAGIAPATAQAGHWMLLGIVLAAAAAACSAMSTADLGETYTGPGAGYRYTREQLGVWPGRLAGSAIVAGRIAGAAAVAGAFGAYAVPERPVAGGAIVVVAGAVLHASRIRLGVLHARLVAGLVLAVLALVVVACFVIAPEQAPVTAPAGTPGADDFTGLLASGGFAFFVFLGFERITAPASGTARLTARELRVVVPALVLIVSAVAELVSLAVLRQLGGPRLALSTAPLSDALAAADAAALAPVATAGFAVAAVFTLVALFDGFGETVDAMAEHGDAPPALVGSHARLVTVVGAVAAIGVAVLASPVTAMGVASCLTLFYLAFTNSAARLLTPAERHWPRRAACFGLGFCVLLAMNIADDYLLVVGAVLLVGALAATLCAWLTRHNRSLVRSIQAR